MPTSPDLNDNNKTGGSKSVQFTQFLGDQNQTNAFLAAQVQTQQFDSYQQFASYQLQPGMSLPTTNDTIFTNTTNSSSNTSTSTNALIPGM